MLKTFFATFAIGLLLGSIFSSSVAAETSPADTVQRPNIVVILSDDQAWGDYSFMGHEAIETPRLDQLAKESLTFTRGYVPDSLCRPSLTTIISGLYPHEHGVVGNDPPWAGMQAGMARPSHTQAEYVKNREAYLQHIDATVTMPDFLGPLGYRSMQTGKWWEGHYSRGGFTDGMTQGDFTRSGRHGDAGLEIGRQGMQPIEDFFDSCATDATPFYLWYAPFLPHTPHNPPTRLLEKYKAKTTSVPVAKYWAMCEWFDETCGQLLDSLDRRGLAENTILMYVTDNGWINRVDASRYAPRSKRSPNEGGTRTPIMIRWPGHVTPKLNETQLASSIDLVPTALAAVGIDVPENLSGIDLLDDSAVQSRRAVFGEILEHDIQSMDDPSASLLYRWVIDGNFKLIDPSIRIPDASPELYDLINDPNEQLDLADQHPDKVQTLQKQLDAWWKPPAA